MHINSTNIETPQTTSITFSNKVNRMLLGVDLHGWETIMTSSLVIAGFLAILVGVSTWAVVTLQREALKDSANAFAKYKENAGLEIEKAKTGSAKANAQAANAIEQTEAIRKDNLALQTNLEKERITRLKLQRLILHRRIDSITVGDKSNFDILKPFKGTRVLFVYSRETSEPADLSGSMAPPAINSGWEMLGKWWSEPAAKGELIADGITVESYVGVNGETDTSSAAADAFADFLKSQHMDEVHRKPAKSGTLPPNSIRVFIGQMPDPFLRERTNK